MFILILGDIDRVEAWQDLIRQSIKLYYMLLIIPDLSIPEIQISFHE